MAYKDGHYDIIIVGTGFASSFFLLGLLKKIRRGQRILVLEAGARFGHAALLASRRFLHNECAQYFVNKNDKKPWIFSRAFGGGSNCWFGTTPRMLPQDFKMKTFYNVGADWPLDYEELEAFYVEAESAMMIAGDADMPYPLSTAYPLPAHRFSTVDQLLKAAYPHAFTPVPTARASRSGPRAMCCNNGVCNLCPVDAKFTIANGLSAIYEHPQITLLYEAPVIGLTHSQHVISGVTYRAEGSERVAKADLIVLGANALFNPYLLLKSGLSTPHTGMGLCEQVGVTVALTLEGLKNTHGSTITTGLGFNDMFGDHRRERGAFLYHTTNRARNLSLEKGKELSQIEIILVIEDLRQDMNRVVLGDNPDKPYIEYTTHSAYAQRTIDILPQRLQEIFSVLPISNMHIHGLRPTESHIQGTTVMGTEAANSVVDKTCLHHLFRNLLVLGSGAFPTASPANPSLTIAALSLLSAHRISV